VDITLSGDGTNHGGADGGGRLETATNSFGKRLEESLEVASRQVEELSDKEHRLWRRDASFEVWRSERHNGGANSGGSAHSVNSGGEGQEASTGAENEDKNEELDIVEQRLLQLDQSIHAKVSAVAAVATPIRGERNEGEDEEDETFTI
jgi:hypothetical protein